jgi:hypothetical protein
MIDDKEIVAKNVTLVLVIRKDVYIAVYSIAAFFVTLTYTNYVKMSFYKSKQILIGCVILVWIGICRGIFQVSPQIPLKVFDACLRPSVRTTWESYIIWVGNRNLCQSVQLQAV